MSDMKKNAFIIAEYNPFHNGHQYHIKETLKAGAENIICIMNGNFVQRGEPALCSKLLRAEFAVKNGADLVIELPVKYGISDASHFARGGVLTANATGLAGTLSFGACAAPEALQKLAEISRSQGFLQQVRKVSENEGKNYPAAFNKVLSLTDESLCRLTDDANNVLGLEYIHVINKTNSTLDYFVVNRSVLAPHDASAPADALASAKYIRDNITSGNLAEAEKYMPENVFAILTDTLNKGKCAEKREFFDRAALSYLFHLQTEDFTFINGVAQGLENRIINAIRESSSLTALYDNVKTKRFTHARIRQIILAAVLGVTKQDAESDVSYIRVLAFNEKGKELLREMRKTAKVPVITNLSDITEKSSFQAQKDKETDYLAGKMFELCKLAPDNANTEFLLKPYIFSK